MAKAKKKSSKKKSSMAVQRRAKIKAQVDKMVAQKKITKRQAASTRKKLYSVKYGNSGKAWNYQSFRKAYEKKMGKKYKSGAWDKFKQTGKYPWTGLKRQKTQAQIDMQVIKVQVKKLPPGKFSASSYKAFMDNLAKKFGGYDVAREMVELGVVRQRAVRAQAQKAAAQQRRRQLISIDNEVEFLIGRQGFKPQSQRRLKPQMRPIYRDALLYSRKDYEKLLRSARNDIKAVQAEVLKQQQSKLEKIAKAQAQKAAKLAQAQADAAAKVQARAAFDASRAAKKAKEARIQTLKGLGFYEPLTIMDWFGMSAAERQGYADAELKRADARMKKATKQQSKAQQQAIKAAIKDSLAKAQAARIEATYQGWFS
jgi:hypothetical protein